MHYRRELGAKSDSYSFFCRQTFFFIFVFQTFCQHIYNCELFLLIFKFIFLEHNEPFQHGSSSSTFFHSGKLPSTLSLSTASVPIILFGFSLRTLMIHLHVLVLLCPPIILLHRFELLILFI